MINQIFFTPKILHKKMTMKTSMTLWITPPPCNRGCQGLLWQFFSWYQQFTPERTTSTPRTNRLWLRFVEWMEVMVLPFVELNQMIPGTLSSNDQMIQ